MKELVSDFGDSPSGSAQYGGLGLPAWACRDDFEGDAGEALFDVWQVIVKAGRVEDLDAVAIDLGVLTLVKVVRRFGIGNPCGKHLVGGEGVALVNGVVAGVWIERPVLGVWVSRSGAQPVLGWHIAGVVIFQ